MKAGMISREGAKLAKAGEGIDPFLLLFTFAPFAPSRDTDRGGAQ
jgi:hypothetical protein